MVAALPGQDVQIGQSVLIDGRSIPSSTVHQIDGAGRPLEPYAGGVVPPGMLYLTLPSRAHMTPDISDLSPQADCSGSPAHSSHSISDRVHWAILIVLAIVVGAVGWSGFVLALPVSMLFPTLWAMAPSRGVAALVSLGYVLAASRGLPQGVANFYAADLWPGLLLWLPASLSFVIVQTALWTGRPGKARATRYLVATVLMAFPPFGITGWAQPITAAGVLFPGWDWGLAATAAGLAMMTSRFWPAAVLVLLSLWLRSAAFWTDLKLPEGWKGVDLDLGRSLGRDPSLER
jgi:hypothetical protein